MTIKHQSTRKISSRDHFPGYQKEPKNKFLYYSLLAKKGHDLLTNPKFETKGSKMKNEQIKLNAK